jgi:outer membrane biosynthesis protein TonB
MVVPEPEPVVVPEPEPEPMVVPEPEPEPVYVPEPEPVVVPEPEPVVEEHKMTADEELAAAFKNVDDAETIVSEPEDDDTEADEPEFETTRTRKSGGKWILALLACIVGLGGGYLLGNYYPYANFLPVEGSETVIHVQKEVTTEPQTEHAIDEVTEEAPIEQQASETDTKEAEAKAAEEAKAAKAKAEADAKAQAEAAAKAKADAESKTKTVSDKYDAMDVRVRLGAYRIVGTDKTVKVKEGENLVKISRRYLGPDMECYLEVYNNIKASTPLKVGQEIKIPKLEWKKKKKTATAN